MYCTCSYIVRIDYVIEPGTFEFAKPSFIIREGQGKAQLFVNRINGADGLAKVNWQTRDLSAQSGKDYIASEGTLEFKHGETQKTIELLILDSDVSEALKLSHLYYN